MKASIGHIVVVKGALNSNGIDEQAAIITRVWADHDTVEKPVMVNVAIIPDMPSNGPGTVALGVVNRGSINLYDNRGQALAAQAETSGYTPAVAFWPDRT